MEVNAAGGLVSDGRGRYLLIYRNGRWDLPKGHQESGEELGVTAVREVQEETGLREMELKDLICVTAHTYFRNERWHRKHTWWYRMLCTEPCTLVPQTEEGIEKAEWIEAERVNALLTGSYPTIVQVFREAKV